MDAQGEGWSADTASRLSAALRELDGREKRAAGELLPIVYDELRRVAQARMSRLPPGQTLQPTALVHEAFLRLVGTKEPGWTGRTHFLAAAALAMRSVLIDHARSKLRAKRGGGQAALPLDEEFLAGTCPLRHAELLDLEDALAALETEDARKAQVVVLRFFGGMTAEEIARALGCSARTVEREWRFARAWLHRRMSGEEAGSGGGDAGR